MADFTQNISNSVRVFGEGPSTKWGQSVFPQTMTWGTSKWGEGQAIVFQVIHYTSNAPTLSWDFTRASTSKVFEIGSTPIAMDMGSEQLTQGSWSYVFTSNQNEAESRNLTTWTQGSNPDATFTCQAANGTSWSEV